MNTTQQDLAVFVDRYTMRYDRRYPHPIDLVWEAVTTSEHLDVWLLPVSKVDPRLGGTCSFTWGGPEEEGMDVGEVTEFDPPRLVTYTFDDNAMRFELEPDGDSTVLHFTLAWKWAPGQTFPVQHYPGADLPAGPDTPWRPGFLAGFHEMLDELGEFLFGRWTAADRAASLAEFPQPNHERLTELYREHVREHSPPA